MFRKATVLFLLAPLAACQTAPGVGLDPEAPLEAAILPPQGGEIGFWVSHPAHVAVFEFAPTRGVALLFPSLAGERNYMARPGSYSSTTLTHFARLGYLSQPEYGYLSPRYLILIASKARLNLDGLIDNHLALRARMEPAAFSSLTPFSPVRSLTEMVVPEQPDGDWTTALYVVWGGGRRRDLDAYRAINCNGVIEYVSWNALSTCQRRAAPADQGKPKPDTTQHHYGNPRKQKERLGDESGSNATPMPVAIERWTAERTMPKSEADMAVIRRATPGWVRSGPDGTIEDYGFLEGGPKAIVAGPRREVGPTYLGPPFRDRNGSDAGDRTTGQSGSSSGGSTGGSTASGRSGSASPSMPDGPRRPPVSKPDGSSPP